MINRFRMLAWLLAAALIAVGCASNYDEELNTMTIRETSVSDEATTTPVNASFVANPAGISTPLGRAFENAPPMISHDVEGMLPITSGNNTCLSCHDPMIAPSVNALGVPDSHLYNLRTNQDLDGQLDQARYNCSQCHAPQASVSPAVENRFAPEFRSDQSGERSNLLDVLNEGVE